MKQKLICDINVWYRIGAKGFDVVSKELENCELHITNISIIELMSSAKLKSDFENVKSAFNAINKYCTKILSQNVVQQILNVQQMKYTDNSALIQKENINKLIESFLKADSIGDLDFDYSKMIETRKNETDEWAANANEMIKQLRKEKLTLDELKIITPNFLLNHVARYIERNNIQIELKKYDFSDFDLFVECYSLFIHDIIGKKGKKIKQNDYVDFMNLLYCVDDFKYLTLEGGNGVAGMIKRSSVGDKYTLSNEDAIKTILNSK